MFRPEAIAAGRVLVGNDVLALEVDVPALEDDVLALEDENDDDPFADVLGMGFAPPPGAPKPFAIELRGRHVRFDGARHDSGMQRGWVTCNESRRHNGCHKYRFVHHFGGCHRATAAWLFAWDCGSPKCESRQAHYDWEPQRQMLIEFEHIWVFNSRSAPFDNVRLFDADF
jgi:hypothetical protein